jgi:hypothetical protein
MRTVWRTRQYSAATRPMNTTTPMIGADDHAGRNGSREGQPDLQTEVDVGAVNASVIRPPSTTAR